MKFVLPRVIHGNRGDLASRWGVLRALARLGVDDVAVFCDDQREIPPLPYAAYPYGRMRNLRLEPAGRQALRRADVALWAVGLDFQDDSSLAKLLYLWTAFRLYRALGLQTWALFQGAGPLTTRLGRWLARQALGELDWFVARDPGTYQLVGELQPNLRRLLAHDAIFLPGFEEDLAALEPSEKDRIDALFAHTSGPVVGLNIRQWFHFDSSLLPYQLRKAHYLERSRPQMALLLAATTELVQYLRKQQRARVLLISAYQPGTVPWEDDLPWLAQVAANFGDDPEVILLQDPQTLPAYFYMMSRLDLMLGMRLHASLIALRLGVPALNLSYTLKGGAILKHLGLGDGAISLADFLVTPEPVYRRAAERLADLPAARLRVEAAVTRATQENMDTLAALVNGETRPAPPSGSQLTVNG